jgi:hypothetical protein
MILITAHRAAPTTYTPWDKQTWFSKWNKDKGKTNKPFQNRIQTSPSQWLIIIKPRNWHLVSQAAWPPRGGSAITSTPELSLWLGPRITSCSCSFPSSDDREGAPIDHAHASFYGGPHSEQGDHPASTSGPVEQQRPWPSSGEAWCPGCSHPQRREDLLHPGACSHVGLTTVKSTTQHCVRAVGWSGVWHGVDS